MYIRILTPTILVLSVVGNAISDKNATANQDSKTKRGIQNLATNGEYNVLPVQHVGTYTQVRSLTQDETPLVDITYKSLETGYPTQHLPAPSESPKILTDNSYEAQNYYPQQLNYEALLQNPQQYFQPQPLQQLPVYGSPIPAAQNQYATNQYLSSYPISLGSKISAPLQQYGTPKSLNLNSVPQLKRNNPISLNSYPISTYSSLFGSTPESASLKLLHPNTNLQYNLPSQLQNSPQPIKLIQPLKTHYKPLSPQHILPHQLNSAQLQHPQLTGNPLFQISQNYKSLEPKFFEPQIFDNPVVPQLQHFIPSSQNAFDKFTNPHPVNAAPNKNNGFRPSPQIKPQNNRPNKDDSSDEDDEEEGNNDSGNRKVKEEIKGEIYHHEVNDEDDFNRGYHDSARGFPAYDDGDDDDHYVKPSYNHDDRNGRYESYKTSSRYNDNDHDDYSDDSHREYTRRPHDYDDDRRSHHYPDHDAEGDYSSKHHKKEPRTQSHTHRESYKYNKKGESDVHYKKPYKQYEKKYYKSTKPTSYKPHGDAKYASDTVKTQSVKLPTRSYTKETSSTVTKSGKQTSEPSYQYGFEPIKTPYTLNPKQPEDQEGKYSSNKPVVKNKIYRENWYLSKTREM